MQIKQMVLGIAGLVLLSLLTEAAPVSSCLSNGTSCDVYENQVLSLPFEAIAGDIVLLAPNQAVVDDFRIFNNLVDTGGGTGLGTSAYLYTFVPSPLSVNAVFIARADSGPTGYYETNYTAHGTQFKFFTPAPEPASLGLIASVFLAVAGMRLFSTRFCKG